VKPRPKSHRRKARPAVLALLITGATLLPLQPSGAAAEGLQESLVTVRLDGASASEPLLLLRDGTRIYATGKQLAEWRIKAADLPSLSHNGQRYFLLNAIAGIKLSIDETKQELSLSVPSAQLELTRISYGKVPLGDEVTSGSGAFVNYDVSAQVIDGEKSVAGVFEAGVFTGPGVGLSNFVARWSAGQTQFVRLDSNWTIDDPAHMRSVRIGDSISRGGVGGAPVRFAGLQLARNFAVQPGFITMPLPTLSGSAAVPSVVDVYVNNTLRDQRSVPPGPFEITDVPIVTGNGDVQLIVRDLLGREQIVTTPYYASSTLLRKGLLDYSYEVGFLRKAFGIESNDYGAPMFSGTDRYGFTDSVTGEAHLEVTPGVQSLGAGVETILGDFGHAEGLVATSHSSEGEGFFAGLGLDRRTRDLSIGLHAEFTTRDYRSISTPPGRLEPASVIQAFLGIPLGPGSLAFSYIHRNGRTEPDIDSLGISSSLRLGRLGSLYIAAQKGFTGDRATAAEVSLLVPFGRTSASVDASVRNGSPTLQSTIQRNLPFGDGLGYRFYASVGGIRSVDGSLKLRTDFGDYGSEVTWTDGRSGIRLSTAGGIGLVNGTLFASRQLDQSFAMVHVGDYPGVRVYADNQLAGRTDGNGTLVIPQLRPFDRNQLRIEAADLPLDAEVESDKLTVRPYDRHGVTVKFGVTPSNGALIKILAPGGAPLPAGSTVRIEGQQKDFVSAPGGEVYLTGLRADNVVTAYWSGKLCKISLHFKDGADPMPNLGDFKCAAAQ